ncbi:MAG: hypothetical protein J7619_10975 [Dyadobacter sp.]|uniref:hypothetical protein n=1 Tax=Dyadobacter sp. TaxID=1914288 RepID=UPI001B094945|nr:hypothetical protein [Dyadobacter sp.]MBO9613211.1 hypothetical protein [Dyadobacter sp.]
MLTERDLLTDIVLYAPESSVWNISSDSWERIPQIFSSFISNNKIYGWDVIINNDNRSQLIAIIVRENLPQKIVHQNVKFNDKLIFESYDQMTGSYISAFFPGFDKLILKYQSSDFDVLELESE